MTWVPIHAGKDHLASFRSKSPVHALAELVWNALDAEADLVDIEIQTAALGVDAAPHVTEIIITDNGHGISEEIARDAFPSLGDSWKTRLKGQTLGRKGPLHGSKGQGRFLVYSLGDRARWTSTCEKSPGNFECIEILGESTRIHGFTISEASEADGPAGTKLVIEVGQDRSLAALLSTDLPSQLSAIFAPHLLGNQKLRIRINGEHLDYRPFIVGQPMDSEIASSAQQTASDDRPVLKLVDWSEAVKSAPGLLLCTQEQLALYEVPETRPKGNVRSTGYLRWSGWTPKDPDLSLSRLQYSDVIEEATSVLAEHVAARTGALKSTIVTQLKEEEAYPYPDAFLDPVREAEREVFDLILVTARGPLKGFSQKQRGMSVQLLQIALQERPQALEDILTHALALSDDERRELADLLKHSSLGAIIQAASEVTGRIDLLNTLRFVIYDKDASPYMREVDQLHPLVRDHAWLFGEEWRLSRSEAGLTSVIRQVVAEEHEDEIVLEEDLKPNGAGKLLLPDGKSGRVDLLLQRTHLGPDDLRHRLVVELKRPSVRLGIKELTQIKRYAKTLASHPAAGNSRWKFLLIGSSFKDEIEDDVAPRDREYGHLHAGKNYDVWVISWGDLLNHNERRFEFYREQLEYSISQEEAVERVRRKHSALLPEPPDEIVDSDPEEAKTPEVPPFGLLGTNGKS